MKGYKMPVKTAESIGIPLSAHRISPDGTEVVVSDMDLRRTDGFRFPAEHYEDRYGIAPLSRRQTAEIHRRWGFTYTKH